MNIAPASSTGTTIGAGNPEALSGVGALVRLLLVRHELDRREGLTTATMVSGYPGSPLGTFDLALEAEKQALDAHRVLHRPGLNEELAAATVWGSQMGAAVPYRGVDGVVGVWYGKAPGLDRSGDVLKHGNAMGSGPNGGTVLLCGDDPTAKSSTLTCDSQYTFQDACIPVLYPGDQQDIVDLGIEAFRLSRLAGCWVGFKVVTSVADGTGSVVSDPERFGPTGSRELELEGRPWRHQPLTDDRTPPDSRPGVTGLVRPAARRRALRGTRRVEPRPGRPRWTARHRVRREDVLRRGAGAVGRRRTAGRARRRAACASSSSG